MKARAVSREYLGPWLAALCIVVIAGCAPGQPAVGSEIQGAPASSLAAVDGAGAELTVFAAVSLTDAFNEIGEGFTRKTGATVAFNFAGSNQLRSQIAQGARADVFASANSQQMENLVQARLVAGEPRVFASNKLVVVLARGGTESLVDLKDVAKPGVKVVVAGPTVPVGSYTLQMLDKAAADAAYGPWFSAAVKKNVVSEELNVRQVVAKVLLGEADAGVVYKTDLSVSEVSAVRTIEIPDPLNVIAPYPIAVTANASQASLARAFVDHVRSPEGRTTLQKYNFLAP